MHHISKSAIVRYSPKQMYDLVNQIDDYPKFLHWCSSASILNQTPTEITASIQINKGPFNQTFSTINSLKENANIHMELKDGPFSSLSGDWFFEPLGEDAAKVILDLKFGFSSKIMELTIAPVFTIIANSQLDAFVKRASEVYG